MNRRIVARVIAMILLAYACAFPLVDFDKQQMHRYQSLSHEALLAKLAKVNDANFDTSFIAGFVIIAIVVLCADALTALVALVINRISPPETVARSSADEIARASGSNRG
jgi:hypothetical protein